MKTTITFLILFSIQIWAGIGVGYSSVGVLPVELSSFTAKQSVSGIELQWVTATEVSNYGFDVERANAGKDAIWEKIGFIGGHGNSNSQNNYSFIDNKPLSAKMQYRLKQIDKNGSFNYTKSVEAEAFILKYDLAQNFPNPYNPSTLIIYSIAAQSNVTIKIYNVLGKLITTLVNENKEAGNYQVNFNAAGLSNGVYFYKIQAGNYTATKKMLLLK
jgi:hypothetical protein